MTDTTYDEARRCPKCDQPGVKTGESGATRRSVLHTFVCRNERCAWHDQVCRVVEVLADGSVVQPHPRDKMFPKLPERTEDQISRQNAAIYQQTIAGGEIRN